MNRTNPLLRIYLRYTAIFTALFVSIAIVFAPLVPAITELLGFKTFLGIHFTGETEQSYLNVLLMGLDKEETRSDVMMVAQLNMVNNAVNIMQIPRDTYIANKRNDKKINSAYGAGGVQKSIQEVKTVFNVDIDKYVIITTSGFRDVIDAVGGIDYNVPMDMDYEDPVQDLFIHLKKGYQHLDGDKAEQYVRFRHGYATGDIGRVEAQSGFIKAAMEQIIEKYANEKDANTQKLLTSLSKMVDTNFTLAEILKYSPYVLNINMDNVNVMHLEGEPKYKNGVSYYIANDKKNAALVREYFTPEISEADLSEVQARDNAIGKKSEEKQVSEGPGCNTPAGDISVYILDYSGEGSTGMETVKETLKSGGYSIKGSVSAKTAVSDKTYVICKEDIGMATMIANALGLETYTINPKLENAADVVIVIGKDL